MANLGGFTLRQTAVVLRTLCQSVRQLHRAGIVHGDLKPDNVLLQRATTGDLYLAKVIDFDDSYPSGDPPPPDQIVGDQRFGAPEWLRYVKQDDVAASELTISADIFTLALVFHVYLSGDLPSYDQSRFGAPAEAVRAGEPPRFDERLDPGMLALMRRMTALRPQDRPTIDEVYNCLSDETVVQGVDGRAPMLGVGDTGPVRIPPPARGSRLRINRGKSAEPPPSTPVRPPGSGSRLRTNFDR
jgi:serine/threonine protein kinase